MPDIVGVFREVEFSPGRVEDDVAILSSTGRALERRGHTVRLGGPEVLEHPDTPRLILAMCQSRPALEALDRHATSIPVVNAPCAIRNCFRAETVRLLRKRHVPFPRTALVDTRTAAADTVAPPCWVKRGDVHATDPADVVFAADPQAVTDALASLAARGIHRAVVQEHVEGTLVKLYGIIDGRFFRAYSATAEPPASIESLWEVARAGAAALGLEVFGGDVVVTAAGRVVAIDVNAWPSFARCRDEAAEAIASYVCDLLAARTGPVAGKGMTRDAGQARA